MARSVLSIVVALLALAVVSHAASCREACSEDKDPRACFLECKAAGNVRRRDVECLPSQCRCKVGASAVWSTDDQGCHVCSCQATADATTAAATARATTRAPATTTRAPATTTRVPAPATSINNDMCPAVSCRCKAGAVETWGKDTDGCPTCWCAASADGSVAATLAPTTLALVRSETTSRPASPICPATLSCRCKPNAVMQWTTDAQGCRSCYCAAADGVVAVTSAPATNGRPATTVAATKGNVAGCDDHVCRCKPNAIMQWTTDEQGCRTCYCAAIGDGPVASDDRRPATAAPATTNARPATTARPATVPAGTNGAGCDGHVCRCKPGAVVQYTQDSNGCTACYCVLESMASPSTVAPLPVTNRRPETTAAPATRPNPATRAPTNAAVETTGPAQNMCPSPYACRCKPGAEIAWEFDANGCRQCFCQAVSTVDAPTAAPATTVRAAATRVPAPATTASTTIIATTRATTTKATARATTAAATTPNVPALCSAAVTQCRCKANAVLTWTQDVAGCPMCYCLAASEPETVIPVPTQRPTTTVSSSAPTCPPIAYCTCSTGKRMWLTNSAGCPVCSCQ